MTALTIPRTKTPQPRHFRFTVGQYHRMISSGILPEGAPFELLDGEIVRKDRGDAAGDAMTIGDGHIYAVMQLVELNPKLHRLGCHLRPQQPLLLPPTNEPEPDGAIVRGTIEDYRRRRPGAQDTLCVIEVAGSSLQADRMRKQRIYANAGIPQYVIINLPERVVEVYTQPQKGKGRYGQSITLSPKQSVTFPGASGKSLTVPVKRLMP